MTRNRGSVLRLSRWGTALVVLVAAVLSIQPASAAYGTYFTFTAVSAKGKAIYTLRATSFTQPTVETSEVANSGEPIPLKLKSAPTVNELVVSVKETAADYSRLSAIETRVPTGIKLSAVVIKAMSKTTRTCVQEWKATPAWVVHYSLPTLNTGSTGTAKFAYAYELMTRPTC